MSYLTRLTPAENILIRDEREADLKLMLKGTLLDLLLRQVLRYEYIDRQASARDKVRRYAYIVRGGAFDDHQPLPHEEVFLGPYRSHTDQRYLLKNLVHAAFERTNGRMSFCRLILHQGRLGELFRGGLPLRLGMIRCTPAGRQAQHTLAQEIRTMDAELHALGDSDPRKKAKLINDVRGNAILLSAIALEALKDLDHELSKDRRSRSDAGGCGGTCGGGWHVGFDSGFDGAADSAGCGGGGDSGCGSGCSGCGGCGGD